MHLKSKNGHNIKLQNRPIPEVHLLDMPSVIKIHPNNFPGIKPKLLVSEGDTVKKGQPIYFDKKNPEVMFASFLPGIISEIVYGDKRSIDTITLNVDELLGEISYEKFDKSTIKQLNRDKVQEILCSSGTWPLIRKRPFSKIPDTRSTPIAIYITTQSTGPYAPSINVILDYINFEYLQAGIDVLSLFIDNSINMVCPHNVPLEKLKLLTDINLHTFSGPHPSGNVGYHISNISPIKDKDSVVWYVSLQDIALIGEFFITGVVNNNKIITVGGYPDKKHNKHYLINRGSLISDLFPIDNKKFNYRTISGDVFSGKITKLDRAIGFYDDTISYLNNYYKREFLGWLSPGINKFSLSNTFLSSIFRNKTDIFSSAMNGGVRSIVPISLIEKMCNLDIMPTMLIKSIIAKDLEMMEELGIYECDPEDFALCSFVDASKMDIMGIVQEGLNYAEMEG